MSTLTETFKRIDRTAVPGLIRRLVDEGIPYREMLESLYRTAIMRPNAGHDAYMIHSIHQLALDSPPQTQAGWLALALEHHKYLVERYPAEDALPLTQGLPAADRAVDYLGAAVQERDVYAIHAALVAIARNAGPSETARHLYRIGAANWDFIGHNMIGVTNAIQTLRLFRWRHLEPTLGFAARTVAHIHQTDDITAGDALHLHNQDLVRNPLPPTWERAGADRAATTQILSVIRERNPQHASAVVFDTVRTAGTAQSAWDAIHLAAAELMWRNRPPPGASIVTGMAGRPLHSNTLASAFHDAYEDLDEPEDRLLMLLQAAGWVTEQTRVQHSHGVLRDSLLTDLEPSARLDPHDVFEQLPPITFPGQPIPHEVPDAAAASAATYDDDVITYRRIAYQTLLDHASGNPHEIKFIAGIFHDIDRTSPQWRPQLLAATTQWLPGPASGRSWITASGTFS